MIAIEFDEVNIRIAENQEEYETLPSYCNTQEGSVMFCMELTELEKDIVAKTGCVYMKVLTFNQPLQPVAMSCIKEDLYVEMEVEDEK